MPTIASIRQQYPQYKDLSDQQLADALHAKYYADVPQAQFYKKVGFQPVSTLEDMARGAFGGALGSFANMADMLDPARIAMAGARTGMNLVGQKAPSWLTPTTKSIGQQAQGLGAGYQPRTEPGRIAQAVGSMAPNALMPGAGGILPRVAAVVAPGLAQEGARAVTQAAGGGPLAQTAASVGGALAGGAGAGAFGPMSQGRDLAPQILNVPEQNAVSAIKGALSLTGDDASSVLGQGDRLPATTTPGLVQLADRTAAQPGLGRIAILDAKGARAATAHDRTLAAVQTHLGIDPRSAQGDMNAIVQAGRDQAKPLYDSITSNPAGVMNDELGALAQRPAISKAINVATTQMRNAGESPTAFGLQINPATGNYMIPKGSTLADATAQQPTAATWIRVHQALGQTVERNPITGKVLPNSLSPGNQDISVASGDLRDALTQTIPGYDQALATSGDYLSAQGAFDRASGKLFSPKTSVADFSDMWGSFGTPAEQAAAKAGIANDILERADNGSFVPGQFKTPAMQQKLGVAFGPQAQPFIGQMESDISERNALNSITGSSATANRLLSAIQGQAKPMGFAGQALRATSGAFKWGQAALTAPHMLPAMIADKAVNAMTGGGSVGAAPLWDDPETNAVLGQALSDPRAFAGLMAKSAMQDAVTAQAKAAIPAGLLNAPAYAAPGISGLLSAAPSGQPPQ